MAEKNEETCQKASRGIVWKDEHVKELLEAMKEETILYSLDHAKTPKEKRMAYDIVRVKLENKGIIYNLNSIINKWKKLKQQYKAKVDQSRRSGTGKAKKWKFFDDIDEICGHRDIVTPVALIDTSLDSNENEQEIEVDDEIVNLEEQDEEKSLKDNEAVKDDNQSSSMKNQLAKPKPAKLQKLSKLEKSLEMINKGFKEVAEIEANKMIKLEEMKYRQQLQHEIKMREMENERRREERQHELQLFSLLMQGIDSTQQAPDFSAQTQNYTSALKLPFAYSQATGSQNEEQHSYYNLKPF